MTSRTMSETTVRVLLFNEKTELFLQEVDIPGKAVLLGTSGMKSAIVIELEITWLPL